MGDRIIGSGKSAAKKDALPTEDARASQAQANTNGRAPSQNQKRASVKSREKKKVKPLVLWCRFFGLGLVLFWVPGFGAAHTAKYDQRCVCNERASTCGLNGSRLIRGSMHGLKRALTQLAPRSIQSRHDGIDRSDHLCSFPSFNRSRQGQARG